MKSLDIKLLAQIADWTAVAVAVSLPWSTSATSILIVVWLLTLLPVLNVAGLRGELATAAGGLPVALWVFAAMGMLWADVTWSERVHGLGAFHRLLVIPLLLMQFRQSDRGIWVIYGLFASALLVLAASFALVLLHLYGFSTHAHKAGGGVVVKDYLSQSSLFVICAFGLLWRALDSACERHWRTAGWQAGLAALFVADMAFIVTSRTAILVAAVLVLLLGWRQYRWKGLVATGLAGVVVAAALWGSSTYLRARLIESAHDLQAYIARNEVNPTSEHLEFLRKSVGFVRAAPLIGHGTGSIADQFRRSAVGATGVSGVAPENPHNQIFAVSIQLGLLGAVLLIAMWVAHYALFRGAGWIAWVGTVIVVDNVVSSLVNSSLFNFTQGWMYVFGVGVVGGMALRDRSITRSGRISG